MCNQAPIFELKGFQLQVLAHIVQHGIDHRYNVPLLIKSEGISTENICINILDVMLEQIPELTFKVGMHKGNYVLTPSALPVKIETLDTGGDDINLTYYIKSAYQENFELCANPLSRFTIIMHGKYTYILCVFHHLLVDGITIDNIKRFIEDCIAGKSINEIHSPYKKRSKLVDVSTISEIEFNIATIQPSKLEFVELDLLPSVKKISNSYNATLAEALLCVYGYAISGEIAIESIVVPHANRSSLNEFNSTGCLAELVTTKICNSGNLKDDTKCYKNQLESYHLSRSIDHNALFSFRVITQPYDSKSKVSFLHENELFKRFGLAAPNKIGVSILFELITFESGLHLSYALEYDSAIYSAATIKNINQRIKSLIAALSTASTGHFLQDSPSYSTHNREGNNKNNLLLTPTIRYFSRDGTAHFHNSNEVRSRIDHYRSLLKKHSVHTILISAPKSLDVFAIIYACYELHICYIPLDPKLSKDALVKIMEQCGINASVIDNNGLVINYFSSEKKLNDIQYVIYTSGSTGEPKGVKIKRDAIRNLCQAMQQALKLRVPTSVFSYANLHFDMSVPDIYLPYFSGGELVYIDEELRSNGSYLERIINSVHPTIFQCTPTTLNLFTRFQLNELKIHHLILGGEKVPKHFTNSYFQNISHVWNFYGPTEVTVWCAYKEITSESQIDVDTLLSGYEIRLYRDEKLSQPYMIGEIYIGGYISSGYVDSRLDEDVFVDLDQLEISKTFYATGDLGEYIPSKGIRLVGRKDGQIKLNGIRIELGEIESAFMNVEEVQDCIATHDSNNNRIYVLVQPCFSLRISPTSLENVSKQLPESKRPYRVIITENIPKNSNGKKDRNFKSIQELLEHHEDQHSIKKKRNIQSEKCRAGILSVVTNILGIGDDKQLEKSFHEYGGSSLKAISIVQQLRSKGINAEVKDLIENRKMSQFIDNIMDDFQ